MLKIIISTIHSQKKRTRRKPDEAGLQSDKYPFGKELMPNEKTAATLGFPTELGHRTQLTINTQLIHQFAISLNIPIETFQFDVRTKKNTKHDRLRHRIIKHKNHRRTPLSNPISCHFQYGITITSSMPPHTNYFLCNHSSRNPIDAIKIS